MTLHDARAGSWPVSAATIEVFVDALDLKGLGFERHQARAMGRPPYHPSTLLKLTIYGYLNRIQSSRRLERETRAATSR